MFTKAIIAMVCNMNHYCHIFVKIYWTAFLLMFILFAIAVREPAGAIIEETTTIDQTTWIETTPGDTSTRLPDFVFQTYFKSTHEETTGEQTTAIEQTMPVETTPGYTSTHLRDATTSTMSAYAGATEQTTTILQSPSVATSPGNALTHFGEASTNTVSTRGKPTDETTERSTYQTEEDITEIAGNTEMSTQTEATHDCGTVTSQEALSSSQVTPLGVRLDGVKDVVKGSAPWVARLYKHERDILCGGALIDSQWVVTAASCFHGNNQPVKHDLSIGIGDHNDGQSGEFIGIEEIYEYEDFVLSTYNHDIALIKLVSPLTRFTDYIKPICLANKTKYRELVTGGALGRVTKWHVPTEGVVGATGKLTEAYVPFVGYQFCKRYFRQRNLIFTKNMFCAGYSLGWTDACFGEIGWPYSVKDKTGRWYMTGVLSWDLEYCRGHTYGVYTRYPKYNQWVQETIAKFG